MSQQTKKPISPPTEILKQMKREENIKKMTAQGKYCMDNNLPFFAWEICPKCDKEVFDLFTTEECSTKLITYCRYCNASFVE